MSNTGLLKYLQEHPEKVPEGKDLRKFSEYASGWIGQVMDIVPYGDPDYLTKVYNIAIQLATDIGE